MIPPTLVPYADRVAALRGLVLDDAAHGRPDDEALERAHAWAAAVGRLMRYSASTSEREGASDALAAVRSCWLVLRHARQRALLPSPERVTERLLWLADEVRRQVLESEVPKVVRTGLGRLLDEGDAIVASERLLALEEADDGLSLLAAFERVMGEPVPDLALAAALRIGQQAVQGLAESTRWRLEAAAERECIERDLWTDLLGRYLWIPVVDPDRRAELLSSLSGAPVEGVRELAAAAALRQPRFYEPGTIQLLLWDPHKRMGHTTELSIELDDTGQLWGRGEAWGPLAWNAIRSGYVAASRLLRSKVAPRPLQAHRIWIQGQVQVDGDSLGLAVALAFYSAWTAQRLPVGCAATGAIDLDGRVGRVDAVDHKVEAWVRSFDGVDAPVLVPDGPDAPARAMTVRSLQAATLACGLELHHAVGGPDVRARVARLRRCVDAVEDQRLDEWSTIVDASPWARLGDEIHQLIGSVSGEERPGIDLRDARIRGALAWLHAGELDLALHAIDGLTEALPPALELLRAVAALSNLIDRDPSGGMAENERIDALLAAGGDGVDEERYRAFGTQGRWLLHRHDPACIPLLRDAVLSAPPWERPRSRVYLAMALRRWAPGEAWSELEIAEQELGDTERRSLDYAASTRVFLRYEQARVLVATGRPDLAVDVARGALRLAPVGFWPRAGILRALAVAQRVSGRTSEAEQTVRELEAVTATAPQAYDQMMGELLAEARGEEVTPPVVY